MRALTRAVWIGLAALSLAGAAHAKSAPKLIFPALTAHVMDEAGVLSEGARSQLEQALADYERGTTNQVVVATVRSLQGRSIEEYGVALGRKWGVGQKGKDNGALLLVAPQEREVRIEVGYGLEGLLTDARSSEIINTVITPAFRAGNMEKGIVDGTQAMLSVLGGHGMPAPPPQQAQAQQASPWQVLLFLAFFVWILWMARRHPFLAGYLLSSGSRFGSSGIGGGWSGGSGGGFSGGGGSFGGGGASGRW